MGKNNCCYWAHKLFLECDVKIYEVKNVKSWGWEKGIMDYFLLKFVTWFECFAAYSQIFGVNLNNYSNLHLVAVILTNFLFHFLYTGFSCVRGLNILLYSNQCLLDGVEA